MKSGCPLTFSAAVVKVALPHSVHLTSYQLSGSQIHKVTQKFIFVLFYRFPLPPLIDLFNKGRSSGVLGFANLGPFNFLM